MNRLRFFQNFQAPVWEWQNIAFPKNKAGAKTTGAKNVKFLLLLLGIPAMLLLLTSLYKQDADSSKNNSTDKASAQQINLALRRTADQLLRISGDHKSRIPAVEQSGANVWRIQLEQPFDYDQLPILLDASFSQYNIQRPYEVAVRQCITDIIDLGYHKQDVTTNYGVPCGGREAPEGCHYIEITFEAEKAGPSFGFGISSMLWLMLGGLLAWALLRRKKTIPESITTQTDWITFGQTRLDVANQVIECRGTQQNLTFRETKLLRLFAENPDRLLERDLILQQVWADEGILVGRSIDVFVSRLRKKLAADASLSIVAVHGVGYKLATSG